MNVKIIFTSGDNTIFENVVNVSKEYCAEISSDVYAIYRDNKIVFEWRCSLVKEIVIF